MSYVVTLTMNPAIDESSEVDHVVAERKLRCIQPRYEPGGGGINVSRALARLGEESLAIYPAGGLAADLLRGLLTREGLSLLPLPIAGQTRINLNVFERTSGHQYRFVFPGPTLSESEWSPCLQTLRDMDPPPRYVVGSGSLPPGVPEDFWARVAAYCRRSGARLVLDASGEPLRAALAEGIYLLKPSLREFSELVGTALSDELRLREQARDFVRRTDCQSLVVSLGAAGALWATSSDEGKVSSPAVLAAGSVGAGDSLLAGVLFFLVRGHPLGEAVRFGVAVASAAVLNPGTELFRAEDAWRLYEQLSEVYA